MNMYLFKLILDFLELLNGENELPIDLLRILVVPFHPLSLVPDHGSRLTPPSLSLSLWRASACEVVN